MFRKLEDFLRAFAHERETTLQVLLTLTDESLAQAVSQEHRNMAGIAWHLTYSLSEMCNLTGLGLEELPMTAIPNTAKEIQDAYEKASDDLMTAIQDKWTDETLLEVDDMYGMKWPRGTTLYILMQHQSHHIGQLTVLMRQAGLRVPAVCGPAKEDWASMGVQPMP